MMRSMFAGVSGLRTHQERMDVIGDNISNTNTVGFKSSNVNFAEMMSQTIESAQAPQDDRGGTDPQEIGLGVDIASIDLDTSQGGLESTGVGTDAAIDGDGYFVLDDGEQEFYSRNGSFDLDSQNYLVNNSHGYRVQGWEAEDGEVEASGEPGDIEINVGQEISGDRLATSEIRVDGNLDARALGEERDITDQFFSEEIFDLEDVDLDDVELTANAINQTDEDLDISMEIVDEVDDTNGDYDETIDYNGDVIGITENADDNEITIALEAETNFDDYSGDIEGHFDEDNDLLNITELSVDDENIETLDEGNSTEFAVMPQGTDTVNFEIFNEQGERHPVQIDFAKDEQNNWEAEFSFDGEEILTEEIEFDNTGALVSDEIVELDMEDNDFVDSHKMPETVEVNMSGLMQQADDYTVEGESTDGYPPGYLDSFAIDGNGIVTGQYTNGLEEEIAQIALASFANPSGLSREGGGLYQPSANSGDANVGAAGTGGRGELAAGSLEMSNVDLSEEFTDMIRTQRGFQGNSSTITTSDEMLQELVNLTR